MTVLLPEFLALSVNFVKALIELRFPCRLLSELLDAKTLSSIEDTLLEHYMSANRAGAVFKHHPFPNSVASPIFATSFSNTSLPLLGGILQLQNAFKHQ